MKRLLLILVMISTISKAMEENKLYQEYVLIKKIESPRDQIVAMINWFKKVNQELEEKVRPSFKSLKSLCICHILNHPREYIKRDGEHRLPFELQNIIRKEWYEKEVNRRLEDEEYPKYPTLADCYIRFSHNGFLSDRIPLDQLLLMEACRIAEGKQEMVQLTPYEQEIFKGMLPHIQKEIDPYCYTVVREKILKNTVGFFRSMPTD